MNESNQTKRKKEKTVQTSMPMPRFEVQFLTFLAFLFSLIKSPISW